LAVYKNALIGHSKV